MTTTHTRTTRKTAKAKAGTHAHKVHFVANYLAMQDGEAPIGSFKQLPQDMKTDYLRQGLDAVNAINEWDKATAKNGDADIDPRLIGEASRTKDGDIIGSNPEAGPDGKPSDAAMEMLFLAALGSALAHQEDEPGSPLFDDLSDLDGSDPTKVTPEQTKDGDYTSIR